jgi:serine/threonine protein kinase
MDHKSYHEGDEPVTGYQLVEYLGRGGFGEVWRATGPGGVQMALKIIRDLDRKKGGKELRALRLLKNIRHPNLVPLTGFWLKDHQGAVVAEEPEAGTEEEAPPQHSPAASVRGTLQPRADSSCFRISLGDEAVELVIAMGLCEQSLFDRLEECRLDTGRGIPSDELLTYLEDAGRAIDLLNSRHAIQHCDIKPQNILLLSGAAQVCDFGLATSIGDVRESSMGAGTIAYGAPEVLLGNGPSAATDQYSLAISYFELRTGHLPFASERISDVLRAKQRGEVDLCLLPALERAVISKAAATEPSERYPSCLDMVRALRRCSCDDAIAAVACRDREQVLVETCSEPPDTRSTHPDTDSRAKSWSGLGALATSLLALVAVLATNSMAPPTPTSATGNPTPPVTQKQVVRYVAPISREEPIAGLLAASNNSRHELAVPAAFDATSPPDELFPPTMEAVRENVARGRENRERIEDPRMPSDFYHNARFFEHHGDHLNARRSYARFLAFEFDFIDPHLRFQRLLVIHDGPEAAREIYAKFVTSNHSLAAHFAAILLEPDHIRTERLTEFLHEHEDFAPAIYELSREYSGDRLGPRSPSEEAEERHLLERFLQLVDEDRFFPLFLDRAEAIHMVRDADARLATHGPREWQRWDLPERWDGQPGAGPNRLPRRGRRFPPRVGYPRRLDNIDGHFDPDVRRPPDFDFDGGF